MRFIGIMMLGLFMALPNPAPATFHTWRINELYSNADGTVQFIEFHEASGFNGQHLLAGHSLNSIQGGATKTFQFPNNLPNSLTAGRFFLVATQGFADLGIVTPNYIVPAGFLFTDGGTLNFDIVDSVPYTTLPADGVSSVDRNGATAVNSPTNYAGTSGSTRVFADDFES
ncbi:MAG: hypothetical protein U1F68_16605 [Gammaproteobacteria bacterium]